MNIDIEAANAGKNLPARDAYHTSKVDKATTSQSASFFTRTLGGSAKAEQQGGYAIDISGSVMDNKAYGGQGKTAEDVMQEAGQQDLVAQRNYMAVMSNSMSDEDFAKLQEDGFHPGSTEVETVVTIVDHIKAALVEGGTQVAGYTDNLEEDVLTQITGSQVMANELREQFAAHDVPLTEENVKAAMEAYQQISSINELSEGAEKYMIVNQQEPTIDHLYLAQYSATAGADMQGKGYYADEMPGYYAKKADQLSFDSLQGQITKVIEEAGLTVNDESIAQGRWLIEKGIPLTPQALTVLQQLENITLPPTAQEAFGAIAAAIADGKKTMQANMADSTARLEKAAEYQEIVNMTSEDAVEVVLEENQTLNIKNLQAAERKIDAGLWISQGSSSSETSLTAKRQLEEVRLSMSISANLHLLKKGIAIDTLPLQELVTKLKEAESSYQQQLTGTTDAAQAAKQTALYEETISKVSALPYMPAAAVGTLAQEAPEDITINLAYEYGESVKAIYEKAGESYETMMTAPRRDMGDSIRKAFQNVDAILEDNGLELTPENRQAVRILGYNSMEITTDNLQKVKDSMSQLQEVTQSMTPGKVLQMIRDGVNPLTTSLKDLQTYLADSEAVTTELEEYSKFLYQVEQKKEITQEERNAFVGVYRLLRQVEKGDSAAIGALVNTSSKLTLGNLLTAVRSSKKQGMDVTINDSVGSVHSLQKDEDSISSQIEKGIEAARAAMQELVQTVTTKETQENYLKEQAQEIRQAAHASDEAVSLLLDNQLPVTIDNLVSATQLLKQPGTLYKKLKSLAQEHTQETGNSDIEDSLEEAISQLEEQMTDKSSTASAYQTLMQSMQTLIETTAYESRQGSLDVKAMNQMYKQISLMGNLAQEERYEAPVSINGEMTNISLRIIHNTQEGGKVTATMQSQEYGSIVAEFGITGQKLSGYVACSQQTSLVQLEAGIEDFSRQLQEEGITLENTNFIQSRQLDITHFKAESGAGNEEISTKQLYQVAKSFIGYIKETLQQTA